MSRIGKLPITVPQGVKVSLDGLVVNVEGPKGKLSQEIQPQISVKISESEVLVERKEETKAARSFHGLYRNLINNMVIGVSQGFSRSLVINGVGYRAEVNGSNLLLNLGYSNQVEYVPVEGVTIACEGPNKVIVSGIDKQKVGQASAEIRSIRPPEPYKGKGVKYEEEHIRRKIGKSGVK
ncbi:MAG: 50S ribosomal protein L6 [Spirochaetales bacterium]|nr:50S ribosomal protein L6 [Spirochaetales bacterium]